MKKSYVYIISNTRNTVLYIGVTTDLIKRIWQHKNKLVDGFSKKYNLEKLVYYEEFKSIEEAIIKEKQMKKWKRSWKDRLVSQNNSLWEDLYEGVL